MLGTEGTFRIRCSHLADFLDVHEMMNVYLWLVQKLSSDAEPFALSSRYTTGQYVSNPAICTFF